MEINEIIGIISIILLIALIPGIFFKKEYTKIENKINQEKAENSTNEENLYFIRIELEKIRNIFYIFLLTIVIPLIIKVILLAITLGKINELIEKL